jgi:hypothetical protein
MTFDYFRSLLYRASMIRERIRHERNQRSPDSMRLLKLHALRHQIKERIDLIVLQRRHDMMRRAARRALPVRHLNRA